VWLLVFSQNECLLLGSGVNEFSQVPGKTSENQTNKKKKRKRKNERQSEARIILTSPGDVKYSCTSRKRKFQLGGSGREE